MTKLKQLGFFGDLLLLVALLTVFGYLTMPHNPFLIGAPVHPYLFVVVLIAIRYGTVSGVETAIALALFYELGGLVREFGSALPPVLELPHSMTISGLFLFAVIAGNVCDSLRHKIVDIEAKSKEAKERLKFLETNNTLLEKTNKELRGRIMEETTTFQTIYEMAEKLSTLEPKYLYPAVLELLVEHLKAESCSFYLLKGESLHLAAQRGWDAVPPEAKEISIEQGIMKQVIEEKRLVSLKGMAIQELLDVTDKVMAVPVCSEVDGQVTGVIAIEKIPFNQFNQQTVRTLSLVAEWTSKALANVALFSKAEEGMAKRDHMLTQLQEQLKVGNFSDTVFQQLDALGETIMPQIGELLLDPTVKPNQKSNLLSALERFQREGKYLQPETYRTFATDSLRNWYSLERYRIAAKEFQQDTEILTAYILEQQEQYRLLLERGLAIMLAKESGKLPEGTDILEGKIPLDEELSSLIETMQKGDPLQIANLAEERWDYKPAPFLELLPELLASPDTWLKAASIHFIGKSRHNDFATEVLGALKDESSIVRETSILTLAQLTGGSDDKEINRMFKELADNDPDSLVRSTANALTAGKA